MLNISKPFSQILYQVTSTSFCVIVIISNIISAKMVPIPFLDNFCIAAGLLTYPLTFLLSDLVTEFFGKKVAKRMVFITFCMNILSFGILKFSLNLPAQSLEEGSAFNAVLGLSGVRIFSSLTAYSVSQITGIQIYTLISRWTGPRFLWIRANGSTWVSQLIDTILIDFLFLYLGIGMPFIKIVSIIFFSFAFKALFSIMLTPIFYFLVFLIKGRAKKEICT